MGLSKLPLSYCTNVHPGQSLAEVEEGLDAFTVPVHERFGEDLAAGLWLSAAVVDELLTSPGQLERFSERLAKRQLVCHTLNAFLLVISTVTASRNRSICRIGPTRCGWNTPTAVPRS